MKRLLPLLMAVLIATLVVAGPVAAKKPATPDAGATVSGTFTTVDGTQQFVGDITVNSVKAQGGDLVASGTIVGELTTVATGAVQQVNDTFTAALDITQSTCEILTLVLGPLHLDILGLVIDLNQVVLEITAEQGPGNLLGNLLCAIAGILDGPDPIGNLLTQIANLLNQILSILG